MRATIFSDDDHLASNLAAVLTKHTLRPSIEKLDRCRPEYLDQLVHPQLVLLATDGDAQTLQKTLADIAGEGPHSVVVIGRAKTPSIIVDTIRSGALDFIDAAGHLEHEVPSLIRRLDSQARQATGSRQTLGVVSTGNVDDASLVAINLATLRGEAFDGCHLLELRNGFGDLAACLQLTPYHTIADLAAQPDFDLQMFEQSLVKHSSGIQLLAAPSGHQATPAPSEVVRKLFSLSRQDVLPTVACFDDVMHMGDVSNLSECEQIVLPMRLDFASIWRTKHSLDRLFSEGIRKETVHLVAIETKSGVQPPLADVREVLSHVELHRLHLDHVSQEISVNLGQPVVQHAPRSPMSRSFVTIAGEIADETPRSHRNCCEKMVVSLRSASMMLSSLLERGR